MLLMSDYFTKFDIVWYKIYSVFEDWLHGHMAMNNSVHMLLEKLVMLHLSTKGTLLDIVDTLIMGKEIPSLSLKHEEPLSSRVQ